MKKQLYGFAPFWRAETLKIKGSGIWLLTLILGIIFPVLDFLFSFKEKGFDFGERPVLPFNWFISIFENSLRAFGGFFFPLAIILLVSRLASLEHKTDTWKLMENQPVSRFSIWVTKWLISAMLMGLVLVIFIIGTIFFNGLFIAIKGTPGSAIFDFPTWFVFQMAMRVWLSGLGLVTLQLALSIVFRNSIWPITIGMAALIISNMVAGDNGLASTFWPYSLPSYSSRYPHGSEMGRWLLPSEWQGLLWVLFAPLAYILYSYRGFLKLAFKSKTTWVILVGTILIFGLTSWLVQKPKILPLLDGRTVISGKIESGIPYDSFLVVVNSLGIEIAKGAIQSNGNFHLTIPLTGDLEELYLMPSVTNKTAVFVGKGDSLFLLWKIGDKPNLQEVKITGTGIANNQYMNNRRSRFSMLEYYLSDNFDGKFKPVRFFDELMEEWKSETRNATDFKTADGYALGSVNRMLQEKLIAVKYLDYAYFKYPAKFKIDRNEKGYLAELEKLTPILEKVPEFDSTLVGWPAYHNFLRKWLVRDLSKYEDKDSAYLQILLDKASGPTRDRLLFDLCTNRLELARDSLTRSLVMQDVYAISNEKFRELLDNKNVLLNRLRKGQPAPLFGAHALDGTPVSIENLKGKFLAIDFWATWCGPCREQSPIFEKLAEKYKSDNIHFLGLSVDANRDAWEKFLGENNSNITQWRANSLEEIRKLYGVEAIPRFALVDPKGNFVNAQLPFPTDANFEVLLRQALGLEPEEG